MIKCDYIFYQSLSKITIEPSTIGRSSAGTKSSPEHQNSVLTLDMLHSAVPCVGVVELEDMVGKRKRLWDDDSTSHPRSHTDSS